jgi:phosphoribosyl 1,2-cyclic phosphate phosphodiesterase
MSDHRAIILGCGSSGGVPRPGGADGEGDWGDCDPHEPRNRRTRCSLLVERANPATGFDRSSVTSVLVDTSPDMRQQLLNAKCAHIDAVLYTHEHADQTHGIDDLRAFAIARGARVPVYIDEATSGGLIDRFSYCFRQREGSWYPAILDQRDMPKPGDEGAVDGPAGPIAFTPFLQRHGAVDSLGFRFRDLAYSSDVIDLPEESWRILDGVKVWIVDALQLRGHGSHAHLEKTLSWIERLKPDRAILTNLHISMDYRRICDMTPDNVDLAYDGMEIAF